MEQNEATDDEGDLTFTLVPRFIRKSVCFCAGWWYSFCLKCLGYTFPCEIYALNIITASLA